jgi:hypothetical protein
MNGAPEFFLLAKEKVSSLWAGDLLGATSKLVDVAVEAGWEEDSLVAAGECW